MIKSGRQRTRSFIHKPAIDVEAPWPKSHVVLAQDLLGALERSTKAQADALVFCRHARVDAEFILVAKRDARSSGGWRSSSTTQALSHASGEARVRAGQHAASPNTTLALAPWLLARCFPTSARPPPNGPAFTSAYTLASDSLLELLLESIVRAC